jgi:biopolymer transport protein ExbB
MKSTTRILMLALLVLPGVALASSWWSGDWKYRKELTLDLSPAAADVTEGVADVPLLVRLSVANFSYFADTKPDGSDMRAVAGDDKTPIKFHVERYDAQNQMAYVWLRSPKLVAGSKAEKIFLYYGNPDAPAASDAPGTYDADQAVILHFGGDALPADSTANQNNASASTAEKVPASFAGAGVKLSAGQMIRVPTSPSLQMTAAKGYTASVWAKFDAEQAESVILDFTDGAKAFSIGVQGARPFARLSGSGPVVTVTASTGASLGQWHQIAATIGGGKLTLFLDGISVGSAAAGAVDMAPALAIGAAANGTAAYVGELDEVAVAHVTRSEAWIKATVKAQGPEASLIVYGADGQKEGGGTSYIGTIAKNLTVDGWVVIFICFAMLIIAVVLMVMKALFLTRVEKANALFLAEFQKLTTDVTVLGAKRLDTQAAGSPSSAQSEAWRDSTLYKVYVTGTDELFKRILHGNTHPAPYTLGPQALAAIRASIDATATRVQQGLAARMVLLTIAISGGPFLGLLGTVVGVMITFAAIAASGDVNINAIAPGIAAALAATVAGLLVAIPSLFGYNWLNTRIKVVYSDNRVFADELLARLAEQHS